MYSIEIDRYAVKQLKSLPNEDIEKIKSKILELGKNPRPSGYIKLKGTEAFRVRVGNYRIIYEINDKDFVVIIVAIGHRKEIYK